MGSEYQEIEENLEPSIKQTRQNNTDTDMNEYSRQINIWESTFCFKEAGSMF